MAGVECYAWLCCGEGLLMRPEDIFLEHTGRIGERNSSDSFLMLLTGRVCPQ